MESAKEFLVNAKKSLIDVEEKKKDINLLKGKKATYEQKVAELTKVKEEIIEKTIKERKQDLDRDFDDRFTNINNRISEAKNKREKERKKNITLLIEKETTTKRKNNVFLKNEIKRVLRENKVSSIVNTKFYLSIFKPSNIGEYFRAIVYFICCFVLIPLIIVLYPYTEQATKTVNSSKILLWIMVAAFFGCIYLLIDKFVKVDDETLKEIRELRKDIKDNLKEIKKISKSIMKDKDDSKFDYTVFDREIEQANMDMEKAKAKQKEAIENFETVVKKELQENIENAANKDIDLIKKELSKIETELKKEQSKLESIKKQIADEYEIYIGKANMDTAKIDKLIDIVNENPEFTIEEAVIKLK